MPLPRPPSEVETITFPVFGLSWFANAGDGTSIQAYCGGGGSAKTGVFNKIVVTIHTSHAGSEKHVLSTEDQVGVALHVYQHPIQPQYVWLVAAMGYSVVRYRLFTDSPETPPLASGSVEIEESQRESSGSCNALAVNAMADRLAVGCDAGPIYVWSMGQNENEPFIQQKLCVLEGHAKAVCALCFSLRNTDRLVTSAKDGTARVWNLQDSSCESTLSCSVADPKAPPPKRPPQVLVRGCAFGDLDGHVVYTVASGRRGKAYLARWMQTKESMECQERTECSPVPISAMSLASDGALLALGGVDGTITLFDVVTWKRLRQFKEVHDLPVTCIAARPYPTPLCGDKDGVPMHAVSASADSQLAFLTLQKRVPRKAGAGEGFSIPWTAAIFLALIAWVVYYVVLDTMLLCKEEWNRHAWNEMRECFIHTVLIASPSRPGILVPPH